MVTIKFKVTGQNLKLIEHKRFVAASDTINYFRCRVKFAEDWDIYTDRSIYFKNMSSDVCKPGVLNDSGYCFVPWEVLSNTGVIIASAVGVLMDGEEIAERLTTFPVELFVQVEEGQISVQPNEDPTPSQYEQFIANVQAYSEAAIQAKISANNSAINAGASAGQAEVSKNLAYSSAQSANESSSLAYSKASEASAYASSAQSSSEVASSKAELAVTASESASASSLSALSAKAASETAQGLAEAAQIAAEFAQSAAEVAEARIENMSVSAETLEPGSEATAIKTETEESFHISFGIPDGYSPTASVIKEGKVATITITDESGTTSVEIRDGEDGAGSGDMLKATYDTNNDGKVDLAEEADSVDWTGVINKPLDYPPSSHNHDSRYYTESEVDDAVETAVTVKDVRLDGISILSNKIADFVGLAKEASLSALSTVVSSIQVLIPNQASVSNKLADRDFVNSSINSVTAFYITKDAAGNGFDSYSQLASATVFYSGGEVRIPTRNDYCIVRVDENHDNGTTRYIYQNNTWEFQYLVNETAFTSDQLKAINSGITSSLVGLIGTALQPVDLTPYRTSTDQDIIDSGKASLVHTQSASTVTDGTFGGTIVANSTSVAVLGTGQVRNIFVSTSEPTSDDGTDGDVWLTYVIP